MEEDRQWVDLSNILCTVGCHPLTRLMLTIPGSNVLKSRSHTNEMQEKSGEAVLAFGSSKGRRAGRQAVRPRATRRRWRRRRRSGLATLQCVSIQLTPIESLRTKFRDLS